MDTAGRLTMPAYFAPGDRATALKPEHDDAVTAG
jgi:hypothetical protein